VSPQKIGKNEEIKSIMVAVRRQLHAFPKKQRKKTLVFNCRTKEGFSPSSLILENFGS
jgi:hypothetical protein